MEKSTAREKDKVNKYQKRESMIFFFSFFPFMHSVLRPTKNELKRGAKKNRSIILISTVGYFSEAATPAHLCKIPNQKGYEQMDILAGRVLDLPLFPQILKQAIWKNANIFPLSWAKEFSLAAKVCHNAGTKKNKITGPANR